MKDAKGHGSNKHGAHASGINQIPGWSEVKFVPVDSLRPRPENTAMINKLKAQAAAAEQAERAAYPGETYRPRPGDARTKVDEIRAVIRSGGELPPLAVNKDRSIEDGENRWNAYKAEGVKMVPVRVKK